MTSKLISDRVRQLTARICIGHKTVVALVISTLALTTMTVPSDAAEAQVGDAEEVVENRARAWWDTLEDPQKVAAVLGEVADPADPINLTLSERQLRDAADAVMKPYGELDDTTSLPAVVALLERNGTTAKGIVAELAGTLYPAGDHLLANNDNEMIGAIRGFQSVELWWNYLDCKEKRIAVGDGNAAGVEGEGFCQTYDGIDDRGDKARVDKVGVAILGRAECDTGTNIEAPNSRVNSWWDKLDGLERLNSLHGDGITETAADFEDDDTTQIVDERFDERIERGRLPYAEFDSVDWGPATRGLVNDRWQWIYHNGGMNAKGSAEVIHWWDSISCAARLVAVGEDNDADMSNEYCASWEDLNPDADAGTLGHQGGTDAGQTRQARVLEIGQAVLDISPTVPDVVGWWATLDDQQKVNVVFGHPLATENADDPNAPETTVPKEKDRNTIKQIDFDASDVMIRSDGLPLATTELLERHGIKAVEFDHDDDDTSADVPGFGVLTIVNAIANELFDPPMMAALNSGQEDQVVNDNEFDWPYNAISKPASVADWWDNLDCRTKRIAVGENNQYLEAAVPDSTTQDPTSDAKVAESSAYCRHFPGSDAAVEDDATTAGIDESNILSEADQRRVEEVGTALLALDGPGRPSYNSEATGKPIISGVAQVGSRLMATKGTINDPDEEGTITYRWFYGDASEYSESAPLGEGSSYELKPRDQHNTIKVVAFFEDGHRFPESRVSDVTDEIVGSPGRITRIEPEFPTVVIGTGDRVLLSVDIFGAQNTKDNSLGATFEWTQDKGTEREQALAGSRREIIFTGPNAPRTYVVTASLDSSRCQPEVEDDRESACSADFTIHLRRFSRPWDPLPPPVNPPGGIPEILTDSDDNQYKVFTPVEGGTFDAGEGFSITVPPGAVRNGEFIGIRMSDEGDASNVCTTDKRLTLGGNVYGVHLVDSSEAVIDTYNLDDPATVCVPLPNALPTNLYNLALVGINSGGSLTIHAAVVRINSTGGVEVCGYLRELPAEVAVGIQGAPAAIPTATPESVPEPPPTGATAPSSNGAVWALLIGIAIVSVGLVVMNVRLRWRSMSLW
ncbi:MAG: hypothetical protein OXC83_05210 [Chloroflexi bacterium]|nr:hypothetical protein [Chloroflexota bacterium]